MLLFTAGLLILPLFFPAPLEEPANRAQPPNPSKAAWFLLWIQELISYSENLVYSLVPVGGYFFFLPYISRGGPPARAEWFPGDRKATNLITLVCVAAICALTILAHFFRGQNWAFVLPF